MSLNNVCHTWTQGKNYKFKINGDTICFSSNAGEGKIQKDNCPSNVFEELFGIDITA